MPRFEDLNWQGLDKLSPAQFAELSASTAARGRTSSSRMTSCSASSVRTCRAALETRRGRMHEKLAA